MRWHLSESHRWDPHSVEVTIPGSSEPADGVAHVCTHSELDGSSGVVERYLKGPSEHSTPGIWHSKCISQAPCYNYFLDPRSTHRNHIFVPLTKVGRPLKTFSSTLQLTAVLGEVLQNHRTLYKASRFLHGDISPSNLVFLKARGFEGALLDWDVSRERSSVANPYPHPLERIGTRSFLSYAFHRMYDNEIGPVTYTLRHELESFLWVLLYMSVRYRPLNPKGHGPYSLAGYFYNTFDIPVTYMVEGGFMLNGGYHGKLSFLRGDHSGSYVNKRVFEKYLPYPLRLLFSRLCWIFQALYPVEHSRLVLTEAEAALLRGNPDIPPIPKELYWDKALTTNEMDAVREQWDRDHLAVLADPEAHDPSCPCLRPQTPEPVEAEPVIDYTTVNDHSAILEAFGESLLQGLGYWWYGRDGAEDQMPALRRSQV